MPHCASNREVLYSLLDCLRPELGYPEYLSLESGDVRELAQYCKELGLPLEIISVPYANSELEVIAEVIEKIDTVIVFATGRTDRALELAEQLRRLYDRRYYVYVVPKAPYVLEVLKEFV